MFIKNLAEMKHKMQNRKRKVPNIYIIYNLSKWKNIDQIKHDTDSHICVYKRTSSMLVFMKRGLMAKLLNIREINVLIY